MSEMDERYQRITLRIPRDMHARLMDAADQNSHSMNAEILSRLQFSLIGRQVNFAELAVKMDGIVSRLENLTSSPKVNERIEEWRNNQPETLTPYVAMMRLIDLGLKAVKAEKENETPSP